MINANLPEVKTLGSMAFGNCLLLKNVSAPKTNCICDGVFSNCTSLETVELTTEEEITMDENAWNSEESEAMAINEQVNLVLNKNKEGEVEGNVWKGITFKSITFKE
ncbi:MAG: leucine-rich repeat protein [Bacteroidaceae bacterium]|nr:leucine-rich repeat protein [Bacteroidaceae bacterium]